MDGKELYQATRSGMPGQIDEVSVLLGRVLAEVGNLKKGQDEIQNTIHNAVASEFVDLQRRVAEVEAQSGASAKVLATYRTTGRNALAAAGLLGTLFGAFLLDVLNRGFDAVMAWLRS